MSRHTHKRRSLRRWWRKAGVALWRRLGFDSARRLAGPPLTSRPLRIVLAEPDPALLSICGTTLEAAGHSVVRSRSGKSAARALMKGGVDVALLDTALPHGKAFSLVKRLRSHRRYADLWICLMTDRAEHTAQRLAEAGVAVDVLLAKPFGTHEVARAVALMRTPPHGPVTVRHRAHSSLPDLLGVE